MVNLIRPARRGFDAPGIQRLMEGGDVAHPHSPEALGILDLEAERPLLAVVTNRPPPSSGNLERIPEALRLDDLRLG